MGKPSLYISNADAQFVFSTMESKLAGLLSTKPLEMVSFGKNGNENITRTAALLEMYRIFVYIKPVIRLQPRTQFYDLKDFRFKVGSMKPSQLTFIESQLGKWGFIAPVSIFVTGPSDYISPENFGDAVGYFFARVSEVTHTPEIKWTPQIENQNNP